MDCSYYFKYHHIKMTFEPNDGTKKKEFMVFNFNDPGVAMTMYNIDNSIIGFARACFTYGLNLDWSVYLSTKNTILKIYDGRFKHLFKKVFEEEFIDINTGLFSKIGLSDPDGGNKGLVNAYDAAAQNVDLIIAIDTPSKEVSKALIKLPSVKKNKLLIVKTADESPDYEKVADKINNRLQKLYS